MDNLPFFYCFTQPVPFAPAHRDGESMWQGKSDSGQGNEEERETMAPTL